MTGPNANPDTRETGKTRRRSSLSRKLWVGTLIFAGIVVVLVGWQRVSSRSDAADRIAEKPTAPAATDVVVVDDKNLQQISTEAVKESLVTVDMKATGKIGFNEDRLTPVFTPYTGRVVELLADKGDVV